jgi:hypothetical protein
MKEKSAEQIQNELREPFLYKDLEFRIDTILKEYGPDKKNIATVFAYVTSRAVQDRLDKVFGIFGWGSEAKEVIFPGKDKSDKLTSGFIYTLLIKHNGEWIKKTDGAPMTAFQGFKGGLSDGLKRSAVLTGLGRYLYNMPALWVTIIEKRPQGANKDLYHQVKDKKTGIKGWWCQPLEDDLPAWALSTIGDDIPEETTEKNIVTKEEIETQIPDELEDKGISILAIIDDMFEQRMLTDSMHNWFTFNLNLCDSDEKLELMKARCATINKMHTARNIKKKINTSQYITYLEIVKSPDVTMEELNTIIENIDKLQLSKSSIDEGLSRYRDKIEEHIKFLAECEYNNYQDPKRVLNSYNKNLGTEDLHACTDETKLQKYMDKLDTMRMLAKDSVKNNEKVVIKTEAEEMVKVEIHEIKKPDEQTEIKDDSGGIVLG